MNCSGSVFPGYQTDLSFSYPDQQRACFLNLVQQAVLLLLITHSVSYCQTFLLQKNQPVMQASFVIREILRKTARLIFVSQKPEQQQKGTFFPPLLLVTG